MCSVLPVNIAQFIGLKQGSISKLICSRISNHFFFLKAHLKLIVIVKIRNGIVKKMSVGACVLLMMFQRCAMCSTTPQIKSAEFFCSVKLCLEHRILLCTVHRYFSN